MENKEFLKKLGIKIKILRLQDNLSQEILAEKANSSQTHISSIENGKMNCSIILLKEIAQALNVDIKELFESSF